MIAAMATILINLAALRRSRWIPPILMAVIGGTAITWLAAGLLGAQPATVEALPGRCRRCRCPTCARCRTWCCRRW